MPQYSSKYYDPVKAHEYYEQHKKLKGRVRKGTLNETGQKAKTYVQKQINEEKNQALNAESERKDKTKEDEGKSYNRKLLESTSNAQNQISSLQKKWSQLSSAQKKILGPKLRVQLNNLRSFVYKKRIELYNQYSAKIKSIEEESNKNVESINTKYSNIYEDELDKMYQDSSMLKQTTKKTATKKTSTTSKKTNTKEETQTKKYTIPPKLLALQEEYRKKKEMRKSK